jgi:hypothetical protein
MCPVRRQAQGRGCLQETSLPAGIAAGVLYRQHRCQWGDWNGAVLQAPSPSAGAGATEICRQHRCQWGDWNGAVLQAPSPSAGAVTGACDKGPDDAGPGSSPLPAGQHFRYAAAFHQADRSFECLIDTPDYGIEAFIVNNIACNIGLYLGMDYFA